MAPQCFETMPRIRFGAGSLETLGEEVRRLEGSRVLVVTDPGIVKAGVFEAVKTVLDKAGLAVTAFTEVESDPSLETAQACIQAATFARPDVVVGVGGGSSLDLAKVAAVMITNEGPIEAYFGMELVPRPGVPLVLIPTTAGTGSEMTSISVLSDTQNQVKKGIVSRYLFARAAILDPLLTLELPQRVTATTGMDALVHAIESFVGVRATVFTDTLNLRAIRLVAGNLRQAFCNGRNVAARENMLYASCLAGMAFSNTQNGLDHALALAIGGRYHLPHGLLTAFLLPGVMEFNAIAVPHKFAQIAEAFGEPVAGLSELEAARRAVAAVRALLDDLGISTRLGDYGVSRQDIPAIARAALGATRLIGNNPRTVTEADVVGMLERNF